MTVHFTIMGKVLAANRGRILFVTFPTEAEAKNFLKNVKKSQESMAAKINELNKKVQEITEVNTQLKEENQQLKGALTDAFNQLGVFFQLANKTGEVKEEEVEENLVDIPDVKF